MTGPDGRHEAADALADAVQRFGLLSAAAVVDRYVAVVDRVVSASSRVMTGDGVTPEFPRGLTTDLGEAATRAVRAVLEVLAGRGGPAAVPEPSQVLLPSAAPGTTAEGRLWVHGPRDRPTRVLLHPTGLVSAQGAGIDASHVDLAPPHVEVAPGGSAEVVVRVAVPDGTPSGAYHGMLVASSEGARPLPVVLRVAPRTGAGDGH